MRGQHYEDTQMRLKSGLLSVPATGDKAFIPSPEKVFLFLGIVYGVLLLFITPPFQIPDEPNHFYRAYQVAEGRLIAAKRHSPALNPDQMAERDKEAREIQELLSQGDAEKALEHYYDLKDAGGIGGLLPLSLATTTKAFHRLWLNKGNKQNVKDIFLLLKLPLQRNNSIFIHFPNSAVYSPVPYLPQALGIATGKLFDLSPLLLMYLGRLVNLLSWVILVYFSIKITPLCKWLFFLLALMPMSIFQAASLSADSFTYGISFLAISVFLRNAFEKNGGLPVTVITIFVVSLLLSLSKQAYFLIPLLFLLIPVEKIGTKSRFYALFFLLFLINISAILLWTSIADIYQDIYELYNALIPGLSAKKQTLFIISHPLEYCSIVFSTFVQNGRIYLDSFIGQLGWFDTGMSEYFRISYVIMLFIAAFSGSRNSIIISLKQRSIMFSTLLFSILLVSTLAFIGWAPVGSKSLSIHGRYFIPLSPLFFLLFHNRKISLDLHSIWPQMAFTCYSFFSLTYTVYVIIERYYIG